MRAATSGLRRPTLSQLHSFVQQVERAASSPPGSTSTGSAAHSTPSLHALLTGSSAFLSSYLPPRLYRYHHAHHYHHYNASITALPSFSALSQCFHRLSRSDEWTQTGGGGGASDSDVARFSQWSKATMEEMEVVVRTVTHELRDLIRGGSRPSHELQAEVDRLLNATYSMLIEMRLQLSHYAFADAVYQQWRAAAAPVDARHIGLDFPLANRCDVRDIAMRTVDTCKAACVEKFGDAPEVEVTVRGATEGSLSMVAVDAHLHFVLLELLKNAMKATIDAHGVLNLHDAQPITLTLSSTSSLSGPSSPPASSVGPAVGFVVSDSGVGLSSLSPTPSLSPCPPSLFQYFFTTGGAKVHEDTEGGDWRYSRAFGNPFTGLGVGLPLCRLYCTEVYGGGLSVGWVPGLTQVFGVLNQHGRVELGRGSGEH